MSNQEPVNNANPILNYYREWAEKTPYITRSLMIVLIISYIVSLFFESDKSLGNTAFFTVLNYEVYRLILSPLVDNSIFNIILVALFFPGMGGRMENGLGSSSFLFLMGTLTLVTNVAFVVVCLCLYYFAGVAEAIFYDCSGFWVILFGLITIECLQNPEQPRRMMMVPVDIPSKYFPLIMYALFSLFTGPKLSFAIAIGIGFLSQNGYLDRLKPSSYYLGGLESSTGFLYSISRSRGWVLAGAALGHDAWIPVNSAAAGGTQQSSGAPTGSSAPVGRGGFGTWSAQENGTAQSDGSADKAPKASTPFGGSGRALGGTAAASTSGLGAWADTSTTVNSKDREAVAARRLAALSHQQRSGQSASEDSRTGAEGATAQDDLKRLQEMGFQRNDAQRALDLAGGSLSGAMQLLTT